MELEWIPFYTELAKALLSCDYKPEPKTLKGYGGSMNIYGITVDTPVKNYKEYRNLMAQYEREFKNTIYMI